MGIPLFNSDKAPQHASPAMALGLQGLYDISSTQKLDLGTYIRLADGRAFVYAKAGAATLAPGKMNQTAAPSANANNETVAASAAVGDQYITVTFGGAVTANFYRGGIIWVNDDTGEPQAYTVKSHAAGTSSVVVYTFEKIRTAITAGAGTVSAIAHPLDGVIVAPTTLTGACVGVALIEITAAYYGWLQVKGACPCLVNGTHVIGGTVEASATTAGALDPTAETTYGAPLGTVLSVNASTEYGLIHLAVPGY